MQAASFLSQLDYVCMYSRFSYNKLEFTFKPFMSKYKFHCRFAASHEAKEFVAQFSAHEIFFSLSCADLESRFFFFKFLVHSWLIQSFDFGSSLLI